MNNSTRLIIRQPDDWHVHLRDGEMLKAVVPYTARQFARAIVMPNLVPAVTDVAAAAAYRQRILDARSEEHTSELQSLMRISYAVFCLKKKKINIKSNSTT